MAIRVLVRRNNQPITVSIYAQVKSSAESSYDGPYEATPSVHNDVVLETAQKLLNRDIRILKVPQYEVENSAKGITLFIGENL